MNTLIAFVVLLSILIFVHELGHYLAARACGVRVLKFSIGFGPALGIGKYRLQWRRGHTEYVIASIPLGGFVKMLGENPDEEEGDPEVKAHPEESLPAKPVWQKLCVVFAGPAMNLVFPVLVFMAMQAVGMPKADAVVGLVEAGSPAAEAGLEPGDRITAIDGEPVRFWADLSRPLRESPGETLALAVERDGEAREVRLDVAARPGIDDFGSLAELGWAGLGHARPAALLGVLDARAPAHEAGLRSGDRVEAVGGTPVEDWYGFVARYREATGSVVLDVVRPAEPEPATLEIAVPALGDVAALGVVRASVLVADVAPDTPAERAGLEPGDLIIEFDRKPVSYFASFAQAVSASEGRPLALVYARDGEVHETVVTAEPISADSGFGIQETRYRIGVVGSEALLPGAVAQDVERNPLVSFPRAVGMTVDFTRDFLAGFAKIVSGEVSSRHLAGPIGIAQIAGAAFEQGWAPYLHLMIFISINLGILNLLPIPVLDGGQALLFTIEGLKRSPLSLRTRLAVQQIGVTVLVLLMGLAFWNDLSRLWSQVAEWLPRGL